MLARRVRPVAMGVIMAVASTVASIALPAAIAVAGSQPASSDLSVSVETARDRTGLGDRVEFVLTVENQGPDAGGGALRVRWTAGLGYVSEQRTGIRGCKVATLPALRASCPFDALDPSATATMTLVMTAVDVGEQTLDVSVRGTNEDPNAADDHDSATITVLGPLAGPTASPAVVRPGVSPSPTPTPAPTPSPTPSPIPSGGVQTGEGGTAGARSPLPAVALSVGALAAGALWLVRRRVRHGKVLH